MPDVLRDAFGSKKFLVFLVGALVAVGNKVAGHFGYELDPDTVTQLVGIAAAYIVGQGIADHGKEAAKVTAAAAAAPTPNSQAGFVRWPLMIAMAVVLALASAFATGCTHSDRADTIHATLIAVDAARDGFVAYDAKEQQSIVDSATSADDAHAKLAAYRAARDKATGPAGLLTTAYRAIAAAAMANDTTSLDAMTTAANQLFDAFKPYLPGGSK
jgi:uncharacterized membrane protein